MDSTEDLTETLRETLDVIHAGGHALVPYEDVEYFMASLPFPVDGVVLHNLLKEHDCTEEHSVPIWTLMEMMEKLEEQQAISAAEMVSRCRRHCLLKLFSLADEDGDGRVEMHELRTFVELLPLLSLTRDERLRVIGTAELDSTGAVYEDSFYSILMQLTEGLPATRVLKSVLKAKQDGRDRLRSGQSAYSSTTDDPPSPRSMRAGSDAPSPQRSTAACQTDPIASLDDYPELLRAYQECQKLLNDLYEYAVVQGDAVPSDLLDGMVKVVASSKRKWSEPVAVPPPDLDDKLHGHCRQRLQEVQQLLNDMYEFYTANGLYNLDLAAKDLLPEHLAHRLRDTVESARTRWSKALKATQAVVRMKASHDRQTEGSSALAGSFASTADSTAAATSAAALKEATEAMGSLKEEVAKRDRELAEVKEALEAATREAKEVGEANRAVIKALRLYSMEGEHFLQRIAEGLTGVHGCQPVLPITPTIASHLRQFGESVRAVRRDTAEFLPGRPSPPRQSSPPSPPPVVGSPRDRLPAFCRKSAKQSKERRTTKLRVSVKDFGAVGDGVTDDTHAIAAAAMATKMEQELADEFELYFPNGHYVVQQTEGWSQWGHVASPSTKR